MDIISLACHSSLAIAGYFGGMGLLYRLDEECAIMECTLVGFAQNISYVLSPQVSFFSSNLFLRSLLWYLIYFHSSHYDPLSCVSNYIPRSITHALGPSAAP